MIFTSFSRYWKHLPCVNSMVVWFWYDVVWNGMFWVWIHVYFIQVWNVWAQLYRAQLYRAPWFAALRAAFWTMTASPVTSAQLVTPPWSHFIQKRLVWNQHLHYTVDYSACLCVRGVYARSLLISALSLLSPSSCFFISYNPIAPQSAMPPIVDMRYMNWWSRRAQDPGVEEDARAQEAEWETELWDSDGRGSWRVWHQY